MKKFIITGAIMAFLSVALGAFGAHALEDFLEAKDYTSVWEKAVTYQMSHALGLIAIGILMAPSILGPVKELKWAGNLLTIGIILFSGSLYVLALSGIKVIGAITPIGGISFLAGWVFVILAAKKFAK